MAVHLDETLVSRIGHLPSRARAVLLAAYTTAPGIGPGGFRRSHTPGISVARRSTPDTGDWGVTIIVEGA